ncbi:MAG: hypothetical protein M0029_04455 [Actinomycetota bacterium]|jgi:hypothetical protein|nr:hypothetical protein [Actinomycetota bacterium]MDA8359744.1 hypothetical protein [Actinomycetota bacterium]
MTQALRRRLGEEKGMVTAFVVIFTLALLAMAGLVLDGGLALTAKVHAIDDAQAAARAGAQAIDIPLYRSTGTITLDPAQAVADAQGFLAAADEHGTVTVAGETVAVTVTITQPTQILSVVGVDQLTVTGTGSATAQQGP